MNKSKLCYMCENYGKVPICYRDTQNVHKVAFYVCKYCMDFSGFINRRTGRKIPYFNELTKGRLKMRLENNSKLLFMKKTHRPDCFKCKQDDIYKLSIRKRDENSYEFIGYVCKNCRTCFFTNTPNFEFRTLENAVHSMGSFFVVVGEDEDRPKEEDVEIRVKKTDIAKLRKNKIPFTQLESY